VNLVSIPPNVPFLDVLAHRWLKDAHPNALAGGLILLPTRRAARSLAEAFLRATDGEPLLLPLITALGAVDEAPLALAGALDLPPAVDSAQRLAILSRMILGLPQELGGVRTADRAWRLARELALLMDEAERAEIALPEALRQAADGNYAAHWDVTLRFLEVVTNAWPSWLAEQGLMNPAARQVALLKAQTEAWERSPPAEPVWFAGITGGIPSVARMLRVVSRLARGKVILPGVDRDLDASVWEAIDYVHPQSGMQRLLAGLGALREDVEIWDGPTAFPATRVDVLSQAMLPSIALDGWRAPRTVEAGGLMRLAPADQQEEAVAIALVLRDALQTPGQRAALVTADRTLARRVSAELLRWNIVADDSAGEELTHSPPAVFLRLLAQSIAERLAPVPLLALLKHPLAAAGLPTAACRSAVRALELACLRGPRPSPGLTGLRRALAKPAHDGRRSAQDSAGDLLARLETCLAPLLRIFTGEVTTPGDTAIPPIAPVAALTALIESAEALAATDTSTGPARLWAEEEGEALAAHLANAIAAVEHLPDQPPACLPGLLDVLLEGEVVRSRRALRGRTEEAEHPRVFIWGTLEARLQASDVVVLGGLVEGVWPPSTEPGPWLSRPMRARAGLPSPEERIGQAAHDFVMAACSAKTAVLSCPRRRDGAPAVPARWLARLDAFLAGQGRTLDHHPAVAWARLLDQPAGKPQPVRAPRPRPDTVLRPRKLNVTEIETWLADPYAIYARHVLRLRPLDPLEQPTDAADYGSLIHAGLALFLRENGAAWPPDAQLKLRNCMERALAEADLRRALTEWWRPRLLRIADWVAEQERLRRNEVVPDAILPEITGEWALDVPGGFKLRGRADRIEKRPDGSLAILDYKTGAVPTQKAVEAGYAPQLPLEAAMAADGAFGETGNAAELTYWHLTGGFHPGEVRCLFKGGADVSAVVATARSKLAELVTAYDDPARPYLSQPHPGRVPRFSHYRQLARVAEWDLSGDEV
jgi:ATP-dependent helicase/nuclease subunit B